jgi:hypothetical protein
VPATARLPHSQARSARPPRFGASMLMRSLSRGSGARHRASSDPACSPPTTVPTRPEWLHELPRDGIRVMARKDGAWPPVEPLRALLSVTRVGSSR